ncbi:hypothetical protein QC761_0068590 [Podospora bellae-mahoneyi]|uniref:Uncharacterized protein n=1 Tax=Podospora bellae-mahoneyi TaxID=2093777 RepID=A0ABR0FHT7_9PEZI|nr:hypothetical protein QC761_0068590 [Podospora bellae-mahoneyi]
MGEKSNVIHTLVMACLSTLLPWAHNMIGLPCRDSLPALLSLVRSQGQKEARAMYRSTAGMEDAPGSKEASSTP